MFDIQQYYKMILHTALYRNLNHKKNFRKTGNKINDVISGVKSSFYYVIIFDDDGNDLAKLLGLNKTFFLSGNICITVKRKFIPRKIVIERCPHRF